MIVAGGIGFCDFVSDQGCSGKRDFRAGDNGAAGIFECSLETASSFLGDGQDRAQGSDQQQEHKGIAPVQPHSILHRLLGVTSHGRRSLQNLPGSDFGGYCLRLIRLKFE
jgi:hypothetical protein